jgi:hypothetical protein
MIDPKELLRQAAQFADNAVDFATTPFKNIAEQAGLPTPPEPPKASEIVESLPDLPAPDLPLPQLFPQPAGAEGGEKKKEVERITSTSKKTGSAVNLRIVG